MPPPLRGISSMATRQVLADLAIAWQAAGGLPVTIESVGGVQPQLGELTGGLGGGADSDTLDYSSFDLPVTAEFEGTPSATHLPLFSGIESLAGSAFSDTLIGKDGGSAFYISGADAGTLDGVAHSAFENLTGGNGADTFYFSTNGSLSGLLDGRRATIH